MSCRIANTIIRSEIENYITSCNLRYETIYITLGNFGYRCHPFRLKKPVSRSFKTFANNCIGNNGRDIDNVIFERPK